MLGIVLRISFGPFDSITMAESFELGVSKGSSSIGSSGGFSVDL